MAPLIDEHDRCADCGCPRPDMHNSREVRAGIWPFRRTVTKRFPGYICVDCWKKANPELFPLPYTDSPPQVSPAVILWALFAVVVFVGFLCMLWFSPSAHTTGYKACVSEAGNTWVACKPKQ